MITAFKTQHRMSLTKIYWQSNNNVVELFIPDGNILLLQLCDNEFSTKDEIIKCGRSITAHVPSTGG